MPYPRFTLFVLLTLAACSEPPDRTPDPAPPTAANDSSLATADATVDTTTAGTAMTDTVGEAPQEVLPEASSDSARLQALNVALDSLEALVGTLERIEGPVAAWNRAGEAARLLHYLEQNRAAFVLDMSREEAARRYPEQISRLNALEARRVAELQRINEDRVTARVLADEMAKADTTAR